METIPIVIDETAGIDRCRDLLLGGVPVRQAELPGEPARFELLGELGRRFQLEGRPAAFWPDGSTKWLHLCGTVDLKGGEKKHFTLIKSEKGSMDGALRVEGDEKNCIKVTGGVLDVTVRPDMENLVSAAFAGQALQPLLSAPGISAHLGLVGPSGAPSRLHRLELNDGDQRQAAPRGGKREQPGQEMDIGDYPVEVVAAGAERVVIRVSGCFRNRTGTIVGELILFLEVLKQCPELRLQPVWIYLAEANDDLVDRLTLTVHTAQQYGPENSYGFSNERGAFKDVVQRVRNDPRSGRDGPCWPLARQIQLGSSYYRTEKNTGMRDASWVKAVEGQRAQGWCFLDDGRVGVTAAMRYYWQEYPHSLAIDARSGTLTFGLIPPEAAPLDLRRYSPVRYGATMYETGEGPFDVGLHGPFGIAKSHELMLRFHSPEDSDAAARALFFNLPCRPMTAPDYLVSTGVLGRIADADSSPAPQAEKAIETIVEYVRCERDFRGWYGLMDYGDIMSSFYSDLDRWAFDDGGYAWINTESLPDLGLWISALRRAQAEWLALAVDMSRHNRDVDCYHRGTLKGCGTRHNVNHWGGADKEWRVSTPLVRRFHYYITADPWTKEYISETVAVYQSYERSTRLAPGLTAAVAGILALWEMTADPEHEKTLHNIADAYACAVRSDGQFTAQMHMNLATGEGYPEGEQPHDSTFFMNTFGGQQVLIELSELLRHRPLAEALTRHADFYLKQESAGTGVLGFLAHAAHSTGRPEYREAIRKIIDTIKVSDWSDPSAAPDYNTIALVEIGGDSPLDTPRHAILPGMTRRNKVACHKLGDIMHLVPYGLAALED